MTVVTLGEAMIAMIPLSAGPLRHVFTFEKHVGGAEFNTSVGLSRLGTPARWIGRVGDDEFGIDVLRTARAEGIDISRVRVDPDAPTGLYFREYAGPSGTRVYYYRRGSAGSRLSPDDIDDGALAGARLLHVSGITPALGPSSREACRLAVDLARKGRVAFSFDPNIRRKLLGPGEAKSVLRPLAEAADILLAGEEELEALFGAQRAPGDTPAARVRPLLERARAAGPSVVVCKLGLAGAVALADEGLVAQPAMPVEVADPIGAGDGFAAGFLHAWLRRADLAEALRWGVAVGACVCAVLGDIEGYPDAPRAAALVERLAALRPADVER